MSTPEAEQENKQGDRQTEAGGKKPLRHLEEQWTLTSSPEWNQRGAQVRGAEGFGSTAKAQLGGESGHCPCWTAGSLRSGLPRTAPAPARQTPAEEWMNAEIHAVPARPEKSNPCDNRRNSNELPWPLWRGIPSGETTWGHISTPWGSASVESPRAHREDTPPLAKMQWFPPDEAGWAALQECTQQFRSSVWNHRLHQSQKLY